MTQELVLTKKEIIAHLEKSKEAIRFPEKLFFSVLNHWDSNYKEKLNFFIVGKNVHMSRRTGPALVKPKNIVPDTLKSSAAEINLLKSKLKKSEKLCRAMFDVIENVEIYFEQENFNEAYNGVERDSEDIILINCKKIKSQYKK